MKSSDACDPRSPSRLSEYLPTARRRDIVTAAPKFRKSNKVMALGACWGSWHAICIDCPGEYRGSSRHLKAGVTLHMKFKHLLAAAALSFGMMSTASAALLITVDGPDNSDDIDFTFQYLNQPGSGPTLTQLVLNATGLGITFDNDRSPTESSPGFNFLSASGWGTSVLTMGFSGWDDGETLSLNNIDLDPNSSDEVQDLIGLLVIANYSSGLSETYRLIDDRGPCYGPYCFDRNGLTSERVQTTSVPEPGTLALLGLGLAGLGLARRRKVA